jgi:hypothetical protein
VNDRPYLPYFPYVAPPHNPLDHSHHPTQEGVRARVDKDDEDRDRESKRDAAEETKDEATGSGAPLHEFQMRVMGANPGSESRLEFSVPSASRVSLKVYDLQGRVVRTLVDQDAAAGTFAAQWDGRGDDGSQLGRGVYFARLVAGEKTTEKKLVLQ